MASTAIDQVYPPGPTEVPVDLTKPSSAYTRNAWLAVGALVLFVALYLGLTGWFGYTTYRFVTDGLSARGEGMLFALLLAIPTGFIFLFLVKGLFHVRRGMNGLRVEVNESTEPTLVAFVNRLADDVGAPRPHRIFLSHQVNAGVFYDVSVLNLIWPTKKNLEIGMGLVNALTLDEMKAVLAHEFGHFAQRSMAIGVWVYVAQQTVGHLVVARDRFDRFLDGLSSFDLRVAWIGWGLGLIIWSIRGVLEIAFRGVVVVDRALSRQMELQADLVSVSACGSDSLVHALFRTKLADEAAEAAVRIMMTEAAGGRRTGDLFAVQSEVERRLVTIRDEADALRAPDVPSTAPHSYRLFDEEFATPPKMWSTHPPSREREDNAKQRYIPSSRDERSAWTLFADAAAARRDMTRRLLDAVDIEIPEEAVSPEESIKAVEKDFDRAFLDQRYLGVYLGRSVVQHVDSIDKLLDPPVAQERSALITRLDSLYPDRLQDELQSWRALYKQHAMLEALKDGILTAPGGVVRFQGREIPRAKLGSLLEELAQRRDRATEALCEHDRAVRSVHRDAAMLVGGQAWVDYHNSLIELLFFLEHGQAEIDDLRGFVIHVVEVVTADGHVSGQERRRLQEAVGDAWAALSQVFATRFQVTLPPGVVAKTDDDWAELLPDNWELPMISAAEIDSDYLDVLDAYLDAVSTAYGQAADATLEVLVSTEDQISEALRTNVTLESAPAPAAIPSTYHRHPVGSDRPRQKRLSWWDRFMLAEGWGPGLARLTVAVALLVGVFWALGATNRVTTKIVNGLGIPVRVTVGGASNVVAAGGYASLTPKAGNEVSASTLQGEVLERFEVDLSNPWTTHVYNVVGAAPLVEWTAVYGGAEPPPPRMLGMQRWTTSSARYIFEEPPKSVQTKGEKATRTVVSAMHGEPYRTQLELLPRPEWPQLGLKHVRWDLESEALLPWLQIARTAPSYPDVVQARFEAAPESVVFARALMDVDGRKDFVCKNIEANATPKDPDSLYLSIRCQERDAQRDAAFVQGYRRFPEHGWLALAAFDTLATKGEFQASLHAATTAMKVLPSMGDVLAIEIDRIRRAKEGRALPPSATLSNAIGAAANVLALELPAPHPPIPETLDFHKWLTLGQLAEAAQVVGSPAQVRLLAASEGAPAAALERMWGLSNDADGGIDHNTLLTSLALVRRERRPDDQLLKEVEDSNEAELADVVDVLVPETLRRAPQRLDRAKASLDLYWRGQAAAAGVVLLGQAAPQRWRDEARLLLFPFERPYIRPSGGPQ